VNQNALYTLDIREHKRVSMNEEYRLPATSTGTGTGTTGYRLPARNRKHMGAKSEPHKHST
jgi:hypothetical protein